MTFTIGVDIGGTNIASVIMDRQLNIKGRLEVHSEPTHKDAMFSQVTTCIEALMKQTNMSWKDVKGIGVGVPGKVDRRNGVAIYQNNLPWRAFPIVDRLRNHFSLDHITIDNDVYVAAWAEWMALKEQKPTSFVYVTISTGIACAIIQDGKFLRGNGFAGELGLLPVWDHQYQQEKRLEKIASGPSIQLLAQKIFHDRTKTTRDFFIAYEKGQPEVQQAMKGIVSALSQGLYALISLLDPGHIVFGGGVVNHHPFIIDLVKERLQDMVIAQQADVMNRIQLSAFKENSGAIGAAWQAMEQLNSTRQII